MCYFLQTELVRFLLHFNSISAQELEHLSMFCARVLGNKTPRSDIHDDWKLNYFITPHNSCHDEQIIKSSSTLDVDANRESLFSWDRRSDAV